MKDPGEIEAQLTERGYAVLESVYDPQEVDEIRARIAARYEALGRPRTWARPPVVPEPDVEISVVGLVLHHLGNHCPEIAPKLVKPEVVAAARALLGDDMHLEYTSAVLSHGDRPFFKWHMHVGGVDNVIYRNRGAFPRFERSERLGTLLYLDDLDEDTGTLLVHPRRIDDPTEPPHEPTEPDWQGRVELRCRRGDVVLLEQCTWHAARPKATSGLRAFVACFYTASGAPRTSYVDESLRPFAADDPLIASVLPPG